MVKERDDEERQTLLCDKRSSYVQQQEQQQSSSLEHAESSWTRYLHILCWWWINPLLSLGNRRQLTESDLDDPPYNDKTSILLDRLDSYNWSSSTTWMIIMKEFWKDYLYTGLYNFPFVFASIVQPLLLREFSLNMMDEKRSNTISYVCVVLLFTTVIIQTFSERQALFRSRRVGVRIRNALMILIFKRAFSIKLTSSQHINLGNIMNLIANDTSKFEEICAYLAGLCQSLVVAIIIFGLLCWLIHPIPTLCALTVFIVVIFIQMYSSRTFGQYRKITAFFSDKRIQVFSECIHGIHVVKMYNWEKLIDDRITQLRKKELTSVRRTSRLRAFNMTQYFASTSLFSLVTFGSAWLLGYPFNAFPVLLCFAVLRNDVMFYIPMTTERLTKVKFASNRIDSFMRLTMEHECHSSLSTSSNIHHQQQKGSIIMSNASFSWNGDILCLSSLDLTIEQGTFVGIIGAVGSGKSSLLAAILGEMNLINGQSETHGSLFAYAAQIPWIFVDTFRNNILLNRSFDEQRYRNVINACCLDIDLLSLGPTGDLTIIGEKGINLSGGQKARVALARALYGDADIYLLDDPLAAVDRVVARQIYERCIGPRGLLKDKTRLLVTHQTQFMFETDQTIYLSHGHIHEQESLNDNVISDDDTKKKENRSTIENLLDENTSIVDRTSIISDEISLNNTASSSVWYHLFTAPPYGIFGFCLLIVLLVLSEALSDGTNYWLQVWLKQSNANEHVSSKFAYIYFGLIIATIIADVVCTNYFYSIILSGSNNLHNNMLKGLLYTSIQFFESNPSGRILNRASKDQHIIDEVLPSTLLTALIALLIAMGSMFVIFLLNPFVLLILIVFVPAVSVIIRFYHRSSCQIRRLESITRSPIYALFLTSLNGLSNIRAFRAEESFIQLISSKMDVNTSAYLVVNAASQWLALRLTLLCSLIVLITSIQIVFFYHQKDSVEAALNLTCAIYMTFSFQYAIRKFLESQILMTSGERINEYSRLTREEDKGGDQGLVRTSSIWPVNGTIDFRNYSLRHRSNLPYAIRNIDLHIKSGQKVGIIGRTGMYFLFTSRYEYLVCLGAGKSSLFKGVFRFIDRSNVDGQILIDDVDISRITLHQLRSHLTVIPQQTILFSGTLRCNLDPLSHYSDEECWKALEDVQLKQFVSNHSAGLLMKIAESGNNLSVGQCQLINLARAVLKKSNILLIDEATANVDQKTDDLIQAIIHENFPDRTILIIAHRLKTLAKCDRILVLDNGLIVNDDTPANILSSYQ